MRKTRPRFNPLCASPAGRSARAPVVPIRRSERRAERGQRSAAELSIRIAEVTG